jgi:lysozyme
MIPKSKATAPLLAAAIVAGLIVFIPPHEGKRNVAYPDPVRGWETPTICYGHTAGVKRGDVATNAECLAYLEQDVRLIALPAVERHVIAPISVEQGIALGDFAYNVGERQFAQSLAVRRFNGGDCLGAAEALRNWGATQAKQYPGLASRRKHEVDLFVRDCETQLGYLGTEMRDQRPRIRAVAGWYRNFLV